MKLFVILSLLFLKGGFGYSQNASSLAEADSILAKLSCKLSSLNNIQYTHGRELNYSSERYHNISEWKVYFDFLVTDTIVGFKYQMEDSTSKQVFNGTERFDLNKKAKTIQVNDNPDEKYFNSQSALYNSIVTLRRVLPLIVADKTATKVIADTNINNTVYSLVTINIGKRRIQNLGKGFDAMKTKSDFIYKIIIDTNSYLPVGVLQKNNVNDDFIKTSFNHIKTNGSAPSELSWYYSTYGNDYKPAAHIATAQLISNGSLSPQWKLNSYDEDKTISSSDVKGKVVLLDFWIKNCGPCIQSVSHLNELQEKFKGKNFKLISINAYDSREEVIRFCTKHKSTYSVLLNGKAVAEQFGVSGFPAFFVIDKAGKIIYSKVGYGPSFQLEVEQVIKNAL